MTYIQKLPIQGTGPKVFPDAAMDAGTRGLIDLIDPWSWGGSVPAQGSALAIGAGPRNYPLSEDGWIEDAGVAETTGITHQNRGLRFTEAASRIRLPVGFRHKQTDRHIGLVIWIRNAPFPGAVAAQVHSLFASMTAGNVFNMALNIVYNSSSVPTGLLWRTAFSSPPAAPAAILAALVSNTVCQLGFEYQVSPSGPEITYRYYLNGALVGATTVPVTATLAAPAASDYAALGRHGNYTGTGINGTVWRAFLEQADIVGSRPFAETVALDYELNGARIAALA